jgi:dihydropteroate synthase
MAIINRTQDSFFTSTGTSDVDAALALAREHLAGGADLIDVGGVRAGQEGPWVDEDAEVARVLPFLEALRAEHPDVIISLDTWRTPVLAACAHVGIDLVNDTWAGYDPDLARAAAEIGAGYVVSHTGGLPPRTDPVNISYGSTPEAVVDDVLSGLDAGARRALEAGVPADRILVDPTLDFGKTTRNSLAALRATDRVVALGFPVLQAISRKDFVGETLDLPASERLEGSLAATAVAAWLGASVFRTHDVLPTRRVLDMVASIRGERPPALATRGEPTAP